MKEASRPDSLELTVQETRCRKYAVTVTVAATSSQLLVLSDIGTELGTVDEINPDSELQVMTSLGSPFFQNIDWVLPQRASCFQMENPSLSARK